MTTRYTVACWCDGPEWVVHVQELDRASCAARLAEVPGVARDLVASWSAEDPDVVEFDYHVLPDALSGELAQARPAPADRLEARVEALTVRNGLAWRLATEGMRLHNLDAVVGVPAHWVEQLADEALGPVRAPWDGLESQNTVGDEPAHDGYQHEAFLYSDDAAYLAGSVPFIRQGLALGQPVMVAVPTRQLGLIREALGDDADRVQLVDMTDMGHNPARIIPAWRRFVEAEGAGRRPVRGIGEPIWAGRRPAELVECQFHEALLNIALDPATPLWLRCPYDTSALPAAVLDEAAHSHPIVVDPDAYGSSDAYGGLGHVETMFADDLPEPIVPVDTLVFGAAMLGAVRQAVIRRGLAEGLDAARTADVALAVWEIARDSVYHGGGRGVLRLWRDADEFVCEVRDDRPVTDPLTGRRLPRSSRVARDGSWLANQLCDLVQVRSPRQGAVFRVVSWL